MDECWPAQQPAAAPTPSEPACVPDCYQHRDDTRQYLQQHVLSHVEAGLHALLQELQTQRMQVMNSARACALDCTMSQRSRAAPAALHCTAQLAAGGGSDEAGWLRRDWRPFCAHSWLAEYLLAHKPGGVAAPQAAADAGGGCAAVAAGQQAGVRTHNGGA